MQPSTASARDPPASRRLGVRPSHAESAGADGEIQGGPSNCEFPRMAESVALTPEEQRQFRPLFTQYDTDGTNIVLGERIRPLLERSGLPAITLSQIWQTVDTENRGFLDFTDFSRCMRLVYHVQHGQQLSPRLANIPSALPDLNHAAAPAVAAPPQAPAPRVSSPGTQPTGPLTALSTGGSTFSANGETRIPALTTQDKKRFGTLFDRSVSSPDGLMDGNVAKEIFLKARLSPDTLGKVWSLVDVDGRGKLTKNEFVVAMHLIQSLIGKTMTSLPSALPPAWAPWLGQHQSAPAAHPSPAAPGHTGPAFQSPRSPSAEISSPPPPVPPTSKVASLSIAPLERTQYDSIFDSLDKSNTGILGPAEAVPVLTKSGLSDEVLARVWDLADRQKRGKLDKSDFALAMHLLKAKMNGKELPDTVGSASPPPPAAASPPPFDPSMHAPPQRRSTTGTLAQQNSGSFVPRPPQRSLTQQSTSSSLDDLVSLDNAVFRPLEPKSARAEPIPEETTEPSNDVKFVPTTTFGQQLLQNRARSGSAQSPAAQSPPPAPVSQHDASAGAAQGARSPPPPESQYQAPKPPAAQQPAPDLQQQSRELHELESRIVAQQRERSAAHEELASVLKKKSDLETKVRELRETYDKNAKEVHQAKQATAEAQEAIKQLEKDIALRSSGLEAIRSQQQEQNTARSAAESRRAELQEQLTQMQAEIDSHNVESQRLTTEHEQHKSAIQEHEAKLAQFREEADKSSWRRKELEAEVLRHKERAAQAQAAANAQRQRAEAEAAAASEAAARAKAEQEAADTHARSLSRPVTAVATTTAETEIPGQQQQPPVAHPEVNQAGAPRGLPPHLNSLNSGSESVAESVTAAETPRTSPPTSEANYPGLEQVSTPTFTLPMQQPHSATSSVVNNPPQSVRGDFGSEPSEPQSPDLSTPVSGINPPESMDLRRGPEDNDSFEFVDAREGQGDPEGSLGGGAEIESSDDDTGPADPIPQKYGETTPRKLPTELQAPGSGSNANNVPFASENIEPAHEASRSSAVPPPPFPGQPTPVSQSPLPHAAPTPAANGVQSPAQPQPSTQPTTQPREVAPLQQPNLGVPSDDFDGFDDLEEAREDEADDFGAAFTSSHTNNTSSAGPDEWQQLFASSSTQPSASTGPQSVQQPQPQSGAIAELTSMGFTEDEARGALELHRNNLSEATNYLLDRM